MYSRRKKYKKILSFVFGLSLILTLVAQAKTMESTEQQGQVCTDNNLIYHTCSDQLSTFKKQFEKSNKSKSKLLIVFGANWCPPCRKLSQNLEDASVLDKSVASLDRIHVGMSDMKGMDSTSGQQVLEYLNKVSGSHIKINYYPTVFIIDFEKGEILNIDRYPMADINKFTDFFKKIIKGEIN